MDSERERGFERERDWTQGPAKWAAVVVLGTACILTSAWVMTGRVRIEREANGAVQPAPAAMPVPVAALAPVTPRVVAPDIEVAGESLSAAAGPSVEEASATAAPAQTSEPDSAAPQPRDTDTPSIARKININTASAAELELLPGVGPKLAERIIEHRRVNGAFKKVDDLDAVSGIGPRILERLRGMVTVE